MTVMLKLLNGPMQGRSLHLPPGSLTLGLGDVDLLVTFDGGLPRVTLHVTDRGVSLESKVPCWVEGRVFQGDILPTGKIIDLAGQGLVLLNEGENFTPRRIPERLDMGRWSLSRLQKRMLAAFATAALVTASCTALYLWQHQENVSEQVDRIGIQRWLAQQHKTKALRTLGFEWQKNGILRIYGECLNQQTLEDLTQILRSKGVFWRLQTRCQDRLLDDVHDVLAQNGYQRLTVGDGRWPGEVRIRGDIQADERWNQVVRQLIEVDGLKSWSVNGGMASRTRWLDAVRGAGLLGRLSMEKQNDRLVVSGLLNKAERQQLRQALQNLLEEERLTLIFQAISPIGSFSKDIFPQLVISVGGSKLSPYLTLADGRRLQVGAVLNQGFEIAAIDPQRGIDVYREGQLLHLAWTQ
jgi:type III secretion protein D